MLLHFLAGSLSLTHALSFPRDLATPATKDASILSSASPSCVCPLASSSSSSSSDCSTCPLGGSPTLQAGTPSSGSYTSRALISFQLPVQQDTISACTLVVPAFTNRTHDAVQVTILSALSSAWDEETVDDATAPEEGPVLASVYVDEVSNLPPVDVSGGCHLADEQGRVSIYIVAEDGLMEFWAKASGNPAILKIVQS